MKNIFVIGLEPFNLELMRRSESRREFRFHELLSYREAVRPQSRQIEFEQLLQVARKKLFAQKDSIDAIIGYWDFPTSALVPILRKEFSLPGPSLEAVAACEHKYWSRLEQQKSIPDIVPGFCAVDPFAEDPAREIKLEYPYWIKPIKAHSSFLGFKIRNEADLRACIPVIRANIGQFGNPFNAFLSRVELPDEIANVTGNFCIAEEIISGGVQCTLEGYEYAGEVHIYGVVDSIRSGAHRSCFSRYQYPSRIPRRVQQRMMESARTFVAHIDYRNAPFNIEFYWSPGTDEIRILEINARISKSHSPLFLLVDGSSHQTVSIDLALGERPVFPHRRGPYKRAAKFMLRVFHDAIVEGVPDQADMERLLSLYPDALVRILVKPGDRLAHLLFQDSYSFEIAEIFLGADDQASLLRKYGEILRVLPFRLNPLGEEAA